MRFDLIENNRKYLKLILTLTYLLRIVTITPNNPKHPETPPKNHLTHTHNTRNIYVTVTLSRNMTQNACVKTKQTCVWGCARKQKTKATK